MAVARVRASDDDHPWFVKIHTTLRLCSASNPTRRSRTRGRNFQSSTLTGGYFPDGVVMSVSFRSNP